VSVSALRDLVVISCAVSAGIHAGLVPDHHSESPALGAAFGVSAVLLASIAIVLTRRSESTVALAAAVALLLGLIAGYALAIAVGLPFLHPEPETVDGIAVATKVVEAIGLGAALGLLRGLYVTNPRMKGELT
jgi:drug/metabolite transporter (DMT)-like permease